MKQAVGWIVAGAAIGTSASVVAAAPAGAGPGQCDVTEVCLYDSQDYNDGAANYVHQWVGAAANYNEFVWFNAGTGSWTGTGVNDRTMSIKNNGERCSVRIHQHRDFAGPETWFDRKTADPWLENNDVGGDEASSHNWFCA